ncbi:MAG: 4Fe-4S dicluster domain-containing protein, partial [Cyclobacteriaceae bacterium]|nr:4Fe-4S dicluster domain-containing protein [Cyclobacteriaceae bacterium]
ILTKAAADLWAAKGASVVVSGSNDENVQVVVNTINSLLGNIGVTSDFDNYSNLRKGDDEAFAAFAAELKSGKVGGIIFYNCNPVYDHPMGSTIREAVDKLGFSLSTSDRKDETSSKVMYVAPDHHYLEAWNDFELANGKFSLSQPTISPIFNTRQAQDSFLNWAGSDENYLDRIRASWESDLYPSAGGSYHDFESFWNKSLQDGVLERPKGAITITAAATSGLNEAAEAIRKNYTDDSSELELVIYLNNSVSEGIQANNPWLQEMPDPITKACWENYLTVAPKQAEEWGIELGDMSTQKVSLTVNGVSVSVPVMPQPGQKYGTVGLALGYGREVAGKVANGVGVNAYPLVSSNGQSLSFAITSGISVENTGESYRIAQTQTHQTYMGRETVIQETILSRYQKNAQAGRSFPEIATPEGFKKPYAVSLWKGHEYANHHWGLVVDLNSCTGCGTCTISCQTENNIPVVGKEEVLNRREMHWLRIDRYYSSDAAEGDLKAMEIAAENPEVTFQPMMCQQCNNAPCETVCPVAATTHSSEGLNQMTYNRCIGTRYCANNCPYKVRRFNWFKYHDNDQFNTNLAMSNDLGKMVLNPDVTVRARGVMEKCTFCVQRVQVGKLEARKEGRRPVDGEITSACAASCPSDALIFGDLKDPESRISKALKIESTGKGVEAKEDRAYHVLEEIRVMPNVWYLTKVRNKDEVKEEASNA